MNVKAAARIKARNEYIDGHITGAELVAREAAIDGVQYASETTSLPYRVLAADADGITVRYSYDQALKAGIRI